MSAGTGLRHSEYNYLKDEKTGLFQIWIFPREKNVVPRYEQKHFDEKLRAGQWQKLVAPNNQDGALMINQDAWISRGVFEAGKKVTYASPNKNNGLYMIVVNGLFETSLGKLETRDALALYQPSLEFTCVQKSDVLIIDVPLNW
jgi:hypothetical protein